MWPRHFVYLVLSSVATVAVLNLLICCNLDKLVNLMGFPGGIGGKELTGDIRDMGLTPRVRKIPWRRAWQPTSVFLPGESHGQRSLVGYSPQGGKELDMTEDAHSELYKSATENQKKHPKVLLHEISGSS